MANQESLSTLGEFMKQISLFIRLDLFLLGVLCMLRTYAAPFLKPKLPKSLFILSFPA